MERQEENQWDAVIAELERQEEQREEELEGE